jgi:hypothetical protein
LPAIAALQLQREATPGIARGCRVGVGRLEPHDQQRNVVRGPSSVACASSFFAATSGAGSAASVAAIASFVTISVSPSEHSNKFLLKQEFLAIMLGVQRPTVTLVMGTLQDGGLITTRYGRIRVLKRKKLEHATCECYEVIRAHFQRLGL